MITKNYNIGDFVKIYKEKKDINYPRFGFVVNFNRIFFCISPSVNLYIAIDEETKVDVIHNSNNFEKSKLVIVFKNGDIKYYNSYREMVCSIIDRGGILLNKIYYLGINLSKGQNNGTENKD